MTAAEEETVSLFTAADRCDRCNAQAHAVALLTGGILLFCRHHAREHWDALVAQGATIEME